YWYAYRRQGERRIKQYAGRTPTLTIARLEELAHTLDKYPSIDRLPQQDRQEHSEHEVPHQMQRTSAVVLEIPRQSVQERALQQTSQLVQTLHVMDDTA